jgi:hypothetical protein
MQLLYMQHMVFTMQKICKNGVKLLARHIYIYIYIVIK